MSNILYGDLGSEHMIFNESSVQENTVSVLYGSTKDYIAGFKSVARGTFWYYVCKYNARNAGYLSGTYEDGQTQNAAAEMFNKTFHSIEDFESQSKNGSITLKSDGTLSLGKNNIIRILHFLLSAFNDGEVVFVKINNNTDNMTYIANVTKCFSEIINVIPQHIRKYLSLAVNMDNGRNKIAKIAAAPIDFRNDKACKYFVDCSADSELEFEPEPIVKYWADIIVEGKIPDSKVEEIFSKSVIPRKLIGTDEYHVKCPYDYLYRVYLEPNNRLFYNRLKNYYAQCINWNVLAKYIPEPKAVAVARVPTVPQKKTVEVPIENTQPRVSPIQQQHVEVKPVEVSIENTQPRISQIQQQPIEVKPAEVPIENTQPKVSPIQQPPIAAQPVESPDVNIQSKVQPVEKTPVAENSPNTFINETAVQKVAEEISCGCEAEEISGDINSDTFVRIGNKTYTKPTEGKLISDIPTRSKRIDTDKPTLANSIINSEQNNSEVTQGEYDKDVYDDIGEKPSKKVSSTQNYEKICRYANYFSNICKYLKTINSEKISINNLSWNIPNPNDSEAKGRVFLSDYYMNEHRFDFHKLENKSYSEYYGLEQYLQAINTVNYKDRDEMIHVDKVVCFYFQDDVKSEDLKLESFYKLCLLTHALFFGSSMDGKDKQFDLDKIKSLIDYFGEELYNRKYNIILFHFLYITFNTLGVYQLAGGKEIEKDKNMQERLIKKYNVIEKIEWLKSNCEGSNKEKIYKETCELLRYRDKRIQNSEYKSVFKKLYKLLKIK